MLRTKATLGYHVAFPPLSSGQEGAPPSLPRQPACSQGLVLQNAACRRCCRFTGTAGSYRWHASMTAKTIIHRRGRQSLQACRYEHAAADKAYRKAYPARPTVYEVTNTVTTLNNQQSSQRHDATSAPGNAPNSLKVIGTFPLVIHSCGPCSILCITSNVSTMIAANAVSVLNIKIVASCQQNEIDV